jgi:hypothetical protein
MRGDVAHQSHPTELVGLLRASTPGQEARWILALLRGLPRAQQRHRQGQVFNPHR